MRRNAAWAIVLASGLLTGCAAMYPRSEHPGKRLDCEGGAECVVTVNVACTHYYGCDLSVDYDLILVDGRGRRTDIVWRLTGDAGAEFPANGIVLDETEFECKGTPEKKQFACTDKHSDFGVFKYRINVTVPQSAFGPRGVPSLDPWIVNR